jgi:hypothetical protein
MVLLAYVVLGAATEVTIIAEGTDIIFNGQTLPEGAYNFNFTIGTLLKAEETNLDKEVAAEKEYKFDTYKINGHKYRIFEMLHIDVYDADWPVFLMSEQIPDEDLLTLGQTLNTNTVLRGKIDLNAVDGIDNYMMGWYPNEPYNAFLALQ